MTILEQKPQEGSELIVTFCDSSTEIKNFQDSLWGDISAREDYAKFSRMGDDNDTVFGREAKVHVVEVKMFHANRWEQCNFHCKHTNPKTVSA